jgi:hypothetical protein
MCHKTNAPQSTCLSEIRMLDTYKNCVSRSIEKIFLSLTARHLQELSVKIGTKWWPVLSCLEQMGFLLVNAGGHVAGHHA